MFFNVWIHVCTAERKELQPFQKNVCWISCIFQVFLDYKTINLSVGANRSRWFDLFCFFPPFLPVSLCLMCLPLNFVVLQCYNDNKDYSILYKTAVW